MINHFFSIIDFSIKKAQTETAGLRSRLMLDVVLPVIVPHGTHPWALI